MTFTKTTFFYSLIWIFVFSIYFNQNGYSQDVLGQDDDQYVDVIVGPNQTNTAPAEAQTTSARRGSWDDNNQINTGLLNYGLTESIYYQFSKESIFKDGNSLTGSPGLNWNWTHFNKLDYEIPPAWSFGAEFLYFESTSESTYSGKGDVSGSSIDMNLYMLSLALKVFFMDPIDNFLHLYWGAGWGVLGGDFKTKKNVTGTKHDTTFNGVLNYQVLGLQIMLHEKAGLMAEFKNMRATGNTSNDPFDVTNGSSVELQLDGVIIGLTGYYRF